MRNTGFTVPLMRYYHRSSASFPSDANPEQVRCLEVEELTLNNHNIHHFLLVQTRHRIPNNLHFGR